MKKTILLAMLFFIYIQINAQSIPPVSYINANGVIEQNEIAPLRETSLPENAKINTMLYDSTRTISEVNIPGGADAYPWISADGLRLYYTDGTNYQIKYTERPNVQSFFGSPAVVTTGVPNATSCWLSTDELDMYVCTGVNGTLHYLHRTSVSSPFSAPVTISLNGASISFLSSVSLDQPQNSLYAYVVSGGSVGEIIEFTRTSTTSFSMSRVFSYPPGTEVAPGQISKDGLKYFFSYSSPSGSMFELYELSRASLQDTFSLSTKQAVQGVSTPGASSLQPSVSDSAVWLVYVVSLGNTWTTNDLWIAHGGEVTAVFNPAGPIQKLDVFPNPAAGVINVKVSTPAPGTLLQYSVLSMSGQEMITGTLEKEISEINIASLSSGMYLCRVSENQKPLAYKKLIVQ